MSGFNDATDHREYFISLKVVDLKNRTEDKIFFFLNRDSESGGPIMCWEGLTSTMHHSLKSSCF